MPSFPYLVAQPGNLCFPVDRIGDQDLNIKCRDLESSYLSLPILLLDSTRRISYQVTMPQTTKQADLIALNTIILWATAATWFLFIACNLCEPLDRHAYAGHRSRPASPAIRFGTSQT